MRKVCYILVEMGNAEKFPSCAFGVLLNEEMSSMRCGQCLIRSLASPHMTFWFFVLSGDIGSRAALVKAAFSFKRRVLKN